MDESQYIISNCNVADAAGLAENNMSAWWEEPTYNLMWHVRQLPFVISACAARFPHRLLEDRDRTRHAKATDRATGRIVGYARWEVPRAADADWDEMRVDDVEDPAEREIYRRRSEEADWNYHHNGGDDEPVHRIMPRLQEGKNFLNLDYIAVHPDFAGRGIGLMLVRHGLAVAERYGWDVFVLANTSAGKGLYMKAGFTLLESVYQDMSRHHSSHQYELHFFQLLQKNEAEENEQGGAS